jgi:hypothetical protein
VLVQAQVLLGRHLIDGCAQDLELGPQRRGDRGRRDDVASQVVAVAGHGQGQGVDAAGAVDQRVAGMDRPLPEQLAHGTEGGVDLQRLEAGQHDVVGQVDERRCLHGVRDVGVDRDGGGDGRDGRRHGSSLDAAWSDPAGGALVGSVSVRR